MARLLAVGILVIMSSGCGRPWHVTTTKSLQGIARTAREVHLAVKPMCDDARDACIKARQNPCPRLTTCGEERVKALKVVDSVYAGSDLGLNAVKAFLMAKEKDDTAGAAKARASADHWIAFAGEAFIAILATLQTWDVQLPPILEMLKK